MSEGSSPIQQDMLSSFFSRSSRYAALLTKTLSSSLSLSFTSFDDTLEDTSEGKAVKDTHKRVSSVVKILGTCKIN